MGRVCPFAGESCIESGASRGVGRGGLLMAEYTRVHRLLKILTLVQGGGVWTPERLASECGVSARTIFRDLKQLEGAGVGIAFDGESGGYRVAGDFFLPPVSLTAQEALSLSVLCEQVAGREQIPFTRPAWQALQKVQASLPTEIRDEISRAAESIVVQTARAMPADGHGDMYDRVQSAIASRRALLCRYESLADSEGGEVFEFDPYTLYFAVRAWYAVGFHHGRGEVRTLKLNRFTQASLLERVYEIPADFSLESLLGNAWRMIRGEPEYEVEVRFEPVFAETVSDTLWHKTQRLEEHDDGSLTFRCRVAGLEEIVWWVLSMGPHCRVVGPEALRELVRAKSAATASLYEPGADGVGAGA